MEKALLVTIKAYWEKDGWMLEDLAAELEELAESSGVEIAQNVTVTIDKASPSFFIGKGKANEIAMLAHDLEVDTVIFGRDLSGTQQRNLEEVIGRKSIDRTQLILDIFARHARSQEGKMQVELAQLQYLMPRLVGKGLIMSQQGAGIGTSGPGEKKLEIDRRRIRKRIESLQKDLDDIRRHRKTMRKRRQENAIPAIALVGYTNAGKSTLLNAVTKAGTVVHDGMFTTLDPLSKSIELPHGEQAIISDTVGFLHGLPHHLIEAFKATLEEVVQSDLLIHVLDVSHPMAKQRYDSVLQVLKELGVAEGEKAKPIITALNKIDLVEMDKLLLREITGDYANSIPISARSGENVGLLLRKVAEFFSSRFSTVKIKLPNTRMDLVNMLYEQGKVLDVQYNQKSVRVKLTLPKPLLEKLAKIKDLEIE